MKKRSTKINGFTLIELMVALTIVAIISGISIFGLTSIRQKAQDTAHLSGLRDTQLSLEAYKSVNGKYLFIFAGFVHNTIINESILQILQMCTLNAFIY